MNSVQPIHTELVLVGGGHSHVEVIRRLARAARGRSPDPTAGVRITLISRDVLTPYSGMLPGLIAGHYSVEQSHIDLRRLCRYAGVRFIHASVTGMNADRQTLSIPDRPTLRYDLVSIDIGSAPDLDSIEGARTHAIGVKPVDVFLEHWRALEARLRAAMAQDNLNPSVSILVVGAGAGGVELSLSLHHRLAELATTVPGLHADIAVVAGRNPMQGHNVRVRRELFSVMEQRGIRLIRDCRVARIDARQATLDDGQSIPFDHVYALTRARPASWLTETGLALDEGGFIAVNSTLQSTSHDTVFAAGDVATIDQIALPRAGVYAVRQGPILADNVLAMLAGERLKRYRPQRRVLALISTGDTFAIASKGPLMLKGKWVWRWKDWIDRTWMDKYQRLNVMMDAQPGAVEMPCAGCAAKVSSLDLRRVLDNQTSTTQRNAATIMIGVDQPDDASVVVPPPGQVLVQSVDHLRCFVDDPWLFADITTLHCINDILAMGARPDSALVALTLGFTASGRTNTDFKQIMDAVSRRLNKEGVNLIGGHTAEGAELSLGLTINGFADPQALITKKGARAGDRLILTKALGTGVILAADMRGSADDCVLDAAIASMRDSNSVAVNVLSGYDAHALTDVTGFGLAGHLLEMLAHSALRASLAVDQIPTIEGSAALFERGYRSSLHLDNEVAAGVITGGLAPAHLFDPQTSGPMLVAIAADQASACVQELRESGYDQAVQIGEVQAIDPQTDARVHLAS